jgi:hypothetical protein
MIVIILSMEFRSSDDDINHVLITTNVIFMMIYKFLLYSALDYANRIKI